MQVRLTKVEEGSVIATTISLPLPGQGSALPEATVTTINLTLWSPTFSLPSQLGPHEVEAVQAPSQTAYSGTLTNISKLACEDLLRR